MILTLPTSRSLAVGGDWRTTTLGHVIELKRGYDLPASIRVDGPYPVVSSSGVSGRHVVAKAKAPGVVIGRYGTLGEVHYISEDYWPLNTALYVCDFKGNDPRFVSYLLRCLDFAAYSDKAAVPGLNRNDLHTAKVAVPPLAEQRAIAHILGTLDAKIELNRGMNETLEAMARALFKSWFVDFDPVRAKMEGRWRRGESLPGLPAHLYELFPDRLVDSELGEIPEGWEVTTIGELAQVVGGATPSTKDARYWEGGTHCWATPKDLAGLSAPVLLGTERRLTDVGLSQIGSGLLPKGTVLLSSRAPIGYLAIAETPVAVNQGFIAMKPKPGVSNIFLLLWAESAHDQILSRANGSTFLEISKTNFRPIPVLAGPNSLMRAFDDLARPHFDRIVTNEHESRALTSLRDTLLPKLISGDLRIKDAERLMADAGG